MKIILDKENYRNVLRILKGFSEKKVGYKEYDGEELAQRLDLQINVSNDEEAQLMKLNDVYKGIFIVKAGVVDPDCIVKWRLKCQGKITQLRFGQFEKNLGQICPKP